MNSMALLGEAEFGCEHVATALSQDQESSGQFKNSFMKINHDLAPRGSPAMELSKKKSPAGLLKPKYTCLTCFEAFINGDRKAHMDETGHMFYMESRNRVLFCQSCGDFVYDLTLERLRSSAPSDVANGHKRQSDELSADDELYISSNANKRPCARQGVRGLFNLGQTCYMNAILQTLLHDPLFNNYFLGNGHHPHGPTIFECLGCALADVVADFNSYEKPEGFPATPVLVASWKLIPSMAGYYQHDAHEWYQYLIDKLHASTEGHSENSEEGCPCFFHKTFYGKLRSSVTCDKCGNVTRTHEPMIDLSLDVQIQAKKRAMGGIGSGTPTLNGCLESFTAPEKLMADVYTCDAACGGTPQKATKQMQIKKLPAVLCMQLKRFEHKSKASSKFSFSDKIEGRIDFPLSINMLPYTTNPHSKRVDKSKYWYDLSSAVIHKGKLESGHYYAYCRQGEQWFLFNDDQVTSVSEAEVLNADAYLLFYHLRTLSHTPY